MAKSGGSPAQDGVIVNELLCFVTNKRDVLPPDSITQLCIGCYGEDEIESAKKLLFDLCSDESTSRFKKRQGPDKSKHNIEDILKLMNEKGTHDLPKFVALNLSNLPPITFDSIDVTVLLNTIRKTQVEITMLKSAVTSTQENANTLKESVREIHDRVNILESSQSNARVSPPSFASIVQEQKENAISTGITEAKPAVTSNIVSKTKRKPTGIVGTAKAGDNKNAPIRAIKASRRIRFANVFATRFDPDVSVSSIKDYLKNNLPADTQDLTVEAVTTKYNTYASFHITAKCPDPSVFMNVDLWPEDIFVRWWREHKQKRVDAQHIQKDNDDRENNVHSDTFSDHLVGIANDFSDDGDQTQLKSSNKPSG